MSRKRCNLDIPSDLQEIRLLLDESDDEDPVFDNDSDGEESDIDREDHVEVREEDSETEQEGDDDDVNRDENVGMEDLEFYLGKNKTTKWYNAPQKLNVRKGPRKTHLPGVIGHAKSAKTPIECWKNFFTDDILNDIALYTNQYINYVKKKYSRGRDTRNTDLIEIQAFFGLLYLAGAYKANRMNVAELWGKNNDGIEKFSLVMSASRFKFLMRCLRFDDRDTRISRKELDKLAPIRNIFTEFVTNCQKNYSLGENVTIDEMLLGFRGKCSFRQYIPSKPNKYGIKIFSLADTKMCYTYNLEIYCGKKNDGPFNLTMSNKPSDVVKRLSRPIFGSGRNITADNWFTRVDLVKELNKEKLSYVGALKKKKTEIPPEFTITKHKDEYSSIYGFNDIGTLVSYVPKKNRSVILLSSLHDSPKIDISTGNKKKPEILTFYNRTKIGVDIVDKMCNCYNVARNSKRWPMVIFFTMLNIGGINSQIIFTGNEGENMARRIFLKQLSHELVLAQLAERSLITSGMHINLQLKLRQYRPIEENVNSVEEDDEPSKKRRRCMPCTMATRKKRMTTIRCEKCKVPICSNHGSYVCNSCITEHD